MWKFTILIAFFLTGVDARKSKASYLYNTERPVVIAHRGAHAYYPEHAIGG